MMSTRADRIIIIIMMIIIIMIMIMIMVYEYKNTGDAYYILQYAYNMKIIYFIGCAERTLIIRIVPRKHL